MEIYTDLPKYCKYMTKDELEEFFPSGTNRNLGLKTELRSITKLQNILRRF